MRRKVAVKCFPFLAIQSGCKVLISALFSYWFTHFNVVSSANDDFPSILGRGLM